MFSPARQTLASATKPLVPMTWCSMSSRKYHFDIFELPTFSDLFNHHECAPQCEYELDEDGVPYQVCTTTIGYDDLYYTIPQEGKELTLTPKTGVRMLKEGLLRISTN